MSLSKTDKELIMSIIKKHLPGSRILFFGSRFRGDHKPYSDLDLCLDDGQPIDLAVLGRLKEELSQSRLLFKVDISDWHRISEEFKKMLEQESAIWGEN